jgi:hypothetical protein
LASSTTSSATSDSQVITAIKRTEQVSLLQLGIERKDITFSSTHEHQYTMHIHKFIFIGYNNTKYQVVAENNGALNWTTPDINSTELINSLLSDKVNHPRENIRSPLSTPSTNRVATNAKAVVV